MSRQIILLLEKVTWPVKIAQFAFHLSCMQKFDKESKVRTKSTTLLCELCKGAKKDNQGLENGDMWRSSPTWMSRLQFLEEKNLQRVRKNQEVRTSL